MQDVYLQWGTEVDQNILVTLMSITEDMFDHLRGYFKAGECEPKPFYNDTLLCYNCFCRTVCEQSVWCSSYLTQQEELVRTFLSVFITGALHFLQVDPIQLEFLLGRKVKTKVSLF